MPYTTIPDSDGTPLKAYLATPADAGPHPGVVVIQDVFGLTRPIREHADRLASYGYLTVAPDLYTRGGMLRCVRATFRSLFNGRDRHTTTSKDLAAGCRDATTAPAGSGSSGSAWAAGSLS